MISCRECIENLKPDDPRVRTGRYLLNGCDYCNKPTYYRELEEPHSKQADEPFVAKQWDTIEQLRSMVLFLQEKINKHIDRKPKDGKYKEYIT